MQREEGSVHGRPNTKQSSCLAIEYMVVDFHAAAEERVWLLVGPEAGIEAVARVYTTDDNIVHDHDNHHYELDAAEDVFNL